MTLGWRHVPNPNHSSGPFNPHRKRSSGKVNDAAKGAERASLGQMCPPGVSALGEPEPDRDEVSGCPVGDGPALVRWEADPEHAQQAEQVERAGPGGRAGALSAALPLLPPGRSRSDCFEPDGRAVTRSVLTRRVGVGIGAGRARIRSNRNPNPRAHIMQLPGAVIENRTRPGGVEPPTLGVAHDH